MSKLKELEKLVGEKERALFCLLVDEYSTGKDSSTLDDFFKSKEDLLNEIESIHREIRFIQEPIFSEHSIYGELLTITEFIEKSTNNNLTDSEGIGLYADTKRQTNIIVKPSDIHFNKIRKDFTHILWINK